MIVAMLGFWLIMLVTVGSWAYLLGRTEGFSDQSFISELEVTLAGWAFAYKPEGAGMWYTHIPLHVTVVAILSGLLAPTVYLPVTNAIARANGRRMVRRGSFRVETQNLKLQLRARGRARLFARGRAKFVRLGLALIGAGVVFGTVLLYPATATGTSGAVYDVKWGLPMWLFVVASPMAILGGLLVLPFGLEDDVVVDASGNLMSAAERVVLPPPVSQPQTPGSA